jgi:Protein of unknown function (DUF3467)
MATEPPDVVYANVVNMTAGPFDLVMDFGFKTPEQATKQSSDYDIVARVAMSLAHAKSMLPILSGIIDMYEKQVGEIAVPKRDDLPKE